MFKLIHNLAPSQICQRVRIKLYNYQLRNKGNLIELGKPKSNFLKKSTLYIASKLFNNLPENIRTNTNLSSFSNDIKNISI